MVSVSVCRVVMLAGLSSRFAAFSEPDVPAVPRASSIRPSRCHFYSRFKCFYTTAMLSRGVTANEIVLEQRCQVRLFTQ